MFERNVRMFSLVGIVMATAVSPAHALKPLTQETQARTAFNAESTVENAQGRFASDGRAQVLYQPNFRASLHADAESMAKEFIDARAAQFGIDHSPATLDTAYQRDDGTFSVVRFVQKLGNVPVYGSDIAVSVRKDGEIIFVSSEARPQIDAIQTTPARSADEVRGDVANALGMADARDEIAPQLMVYADSAPTRLVWVYVLRDASRIGSWEVVADAASGEIVDSHDTNFYVNGTATVFDPDPLTTARGTYGSAGFTDSGDADSVQLTAQLQNVTLNDITQGTGIYVLEGPWARCNDWDPPIGGVNDCPTPTTPDFSVTRNNQKFEGPHVYHLIDKQMRYLNLTLGVTVVPNTVAGGVRFDPHGFNGDDNSSFTPSTDRLTFGEGGVDDAEDADVVLHELGHGLHDWMTNGGGSQTQGLSEGVGDYFASSYNRSTGHWTPSDPQWFWMFHWDGHGSDTWPGRVTNWNLNHTYPGNLGSDIHSQGQYWASCNLVAWVAIGRDAMDKAMLRGLAMTSGSSNQKVAAQAVITAASTMGYTATQINALASAYNTSCTYNVTVPALPDLIFANGFDAN